LDGADDYLHQAADSANWPKGTRYDPENDGTVLGSLGVHEHWTDSTTKAYSRNMGTGEGIELLRVGTAMSAAVGDDRVASSFMLYDNYPNPFNPATTIRFTMPRSAHVRLSVFDAAGKRVRVLVDETRSAGSHTVRFDAGTLASGAYVYTFETPGYRSAKKCILTK